MNEKNAVTTRLNGKNYATIAGTGVDIIDATARFVSNKVIEIQAGEEKEELTAETIIINTGAVPTILPIPGLAESKFAVDSTGIQRLENLPKTPWCPWWWTYRIGICPYSTIPWVAKYSIGRF